MIHVLDVEINAAGHAIASEPDALELSMEGLPIDWNSEAASPGSFVLEWRSTLPRTHRPPAFIHFTSTYGSPALVPVFQSFT